MINDITIFIILAAVAVAALIVSGFTVNMLMHGQAMRDVEKLKKLSVYGKSAAFGLFLIIGFSMVPIMVKLFTDALPEIIKESTFPLVLKDNAMYIVYGFWAVYALGTAIALPAMRKDGFFDPELQEEGQASAVRTSPAGALPPLEYQINISPVVLLARTEIKEGRTGFYTVELWKQDSADKKFVEHQYMEPNIKTFMLLGYAPENGQEVIFFFTRKGLQTKNPLELLPVVAGRITYGQTDSTVMEKLTVDELKKKVETSTPSAPGK